MDWITVMRITGWFDAYYQPEKLEQREESDPGFRDRYIASLIDDFSKRGRCYISKFDSITGTQIEFDNDPNRVL